MSNNKKYSIRKTTIGAASIAVATVALGMVSLNSGNFNDNSQQNVVKAAEGTKANWIKKADLKASFFGNPSVPVNDPTPLKNGTPWKSTNTTNSTNKENVVLDVKFDTKREIDTINVKFTVVKNGTIIKPDVIEVFDDKGRILDESVRQVEGENQMEYSFKLDTPVSTNTLKFFFHSAKFSSGNFSAVAIEKLELLGKGYDNNDLRKLFNQQPSNVGITKESWDVFIAAKLDAAKLLNSNDIEATTDAYIKLDTAIKNLKFNTSFADNLESFIKANPQYKNDETIKKDFADLQALVEELKKNPDLTVFQQAQALNTKINERMIEVDKADLSKNLDKIKELSQKNPTNKELKDAVAHAEEVLSKKNIVNKQDLNGNPITDKRVDLQTETAKLAKLINKHDNSGNGGNGGGSTTPPTSPDEKPSEDIISVNFNGVINYVPGYSVLLRDQNGKIPATRQYLKHGTNWKVNAKKEINGVTYYRLGNNNQWVEEKYLLADGQELEQKTVITVKYSGKGGVLLRNSDASIPVNRQYLNNNTSWKAFAIKNISGKVFYRLGTDAQWISAQYVK